MDIRLISKLPPAESRNKIRVAHLNQENHYHSIDNSSLLYSRFKKMEEYMPFTKKAKSNKKHYPNNLHDQSHIKYLGTNALTAKLESSHDKLQIKDILGASPDSFRNEIFKNRMYGKRIDKKNIFHDPLPLPECLQEIDKDAIKGHLPKITNDLHVPQKQQIQPHSVKLNINPEVVAIRFPDEKESRTIQVPSQRRRIRTELDNHQDYYTEQRNSSIINVRRWNPTYLTDTSNPLLYKLLPKIN